jgi:5-methylcytosine-specific restriction enzyme A
MTARRPYDSGYWRKRREAWRREHPLCEWCKEQGITRAAEVVDHVDGHNNIVEFKTGGLMSLCKLHHDSTKKKAEHRGYSGACDEHGFPVDERHPWNRVT